MEKAERAFLVGVQTRKDSREFAEQSLRELEHLATTAGAEVAGVMLAEVRQFHAATFFGKGRMLEILGHLEPGEFVIVDADLTPAQQRNLEDFFKCKLLDRTGIILDIFARRAVSSEGKLQVELAQLNYLLPRLKGEGGLWSRLGGGIGTRGPGETKLETDRRAIRNRISSLKRELEKVRQIRGSRRILRRRREVPVVAIAGYTNAGKSTLLNVLTRADVLAEDKLFATLDPTTRRLVFPEGREILFTDTVGFIRRLPVQLVEAFKSTLEEVTAADLVLHVVDASDEAWESHYREVRQIFADMGVTAPAILVFNKCDLAGEERSSGLALEPFAEERVVLVSARTGAGLDSLVSAIRGIVEEDWVTIRRHFGFGDAGLIDIAKQHGSVRSIEFDEAGFVLDASVPSRLAARFGTAAAAASGGQQAPSPRRN